MRRNNEKSFRIWDTHVGVRIDAEISHPLLLKIFDNMRLRGFTIGSDPRIDKDFPILSKEHFAGSKGNLLFTADKFPAGFSIEFYQEINKINKNGGKYDFNKFEMMPYLIKKQFLLEARYIKETFIQEGYIDHSEPILKTSQEKVDGHLNSPDRHWNSDNLPDYNALDKDKKRLANGEVKYFRDRKGVLMRGTVHHNINNMWWVILNKDNYTNLASFELFDLDSKPDNRSRKLVKRSGHHNPKSRFVPTNDQIKAWSTVAKAGKDVRIDYANEILDYFYKINWMSRKFQFIKKSSGRLGLVETEGNPYFLGTRVGEKKYDPPKPIPLYPRPSRMSSTESGWIGDLREYTVHGTASISRWFCKDREGHLWPEVRMKLLEIGAMST